MNKTTSNYLQLALFLILIMIFCTLLIQINKKPIKSINQNTNNNRNNISENFSNNDNNFSIIYHSRPEDINWEVQNIKINNKYLNVFTISPLNIPSRNIIYKPLGQHVNISDNPITEDYKTNIKDNIELNLCANKSFHSYAKIWDTNNLANYSGRPFSIYIGINTDGLNCVSYIIKNGLDNQPSVNDFSSVPPMYIDLINDSPNHPIILKHTDEENIMNLFLKKIDNKYIHFRALPVENLNIPVLKSNFLENNFNHSEKSVKITLETNNYQDI